MKKPERTFTLLRVSEDLHRELTRRARENGRSLKSEAERAMRQGWASQTQKGS